MNLKHRGQDSKILKEKEKYKYHVRQGGYLEFGDFFHKGIVWHYPNILFYATWLLLHS